MRASGWLSFARRYGLAAAVAGGALLAIAPLVPLTGSPAFEVLVAAVMVSAWVGGFGPAMVTMVLVSIGADYFLLPPIHSLHIHLMSDALRLGVFLVVALVTSSLTTAHRDAQEAVQALNAELDDRVRERSLATQRAHQALEEEMARRKRAAREREEIRKRLEAALGELATLQGLFPICASCRRFRDGAGYTRQLEAHLRAHAEPTASYGICPACARKLREEREQRIHPASDARHPDPPAAGEEGGL